MIVATGASARLLGLESESHLMGYGVSACATCDGFFFKEKEVVVIGGGDSAMEEATYLTRFCSKVTMVHRRAQLRASKIMQDRALQERQDRLAVEQRDDRGAWAPASRGSSGVKVRDTETGEESDLPLPRRVSGDRPQAQHRPLRRPARHGPRRLPRGPTAVDPRPTSEGVFAAGDVMDPTYRQAVTAAGSGCQAAIDAERWLEAQEA